ncbi:unnamed protein product [Durusdinium trenchii]|uniref:J domain-containing protein n=1 Tax=Durusdinium trenchii TaxID=1381693 RepID=A0ABP0N541_9DINO
MGAESDFYTVLELGKDGERRRAATPRTRPSLLSPPQDASFEEVRRAYLKMALKWHPDKNPMHPDVAEQMFKRVAQAYKVLGDPVLRRRYDGGGERGLGEEWWPKDPEASKDMAYQFFIHRVPGHSLRDGFSEAKLREIFPNLFGRGSGETLQEVPHRSRMSLSSL